MYLKTSVKVIYNLQESLRKVLQKFKTLREKKILV